MSEATTTTIPTIASGKMTRAEKRLAAAADRQMKWDAFYGRALLNLEISQRQAERVYSQKAEQTDRPLKKAVYEAKLEVIKTEIEGTRLRRQAKKLKKTEQPNQHVKNQIKRNADIRREQIRELRDAKRAHRREHGIFRRIGRKLKGFFVGVRDKVLAPIGQFAVKFVAKPVWFALKFIGANALLLLSAVVCLFLLGLLALATPMFLVGLIGYFVVCTVFGIIALNTTTTRAVPLAAA